MSIHHIERNLIGQSRNPMRWIAGSKLLFLAAIVGVGLLMIVAIELLQRSSVGNSSTPLIATAAIVLFSAVLWLERHKLDFRFSDDWYIEASSIDGLTKGENRLLTIIAVRNSGVMALSWIAAVKRRIEGSA